LDEISAILFLKNVSPILKDQSNVQLNSVDEKQDNHIFILQYRYNSHLQLADEL
jgi:hypothetical protein